MVSCRYYEEDCTGLLVACGAVVSVYGNGLTQTQHQVPSLTMSQKPNTPPHYRNAIILNV